jgi:hypothetical protein
MMDGNAQRSPEPWIIRLWHPNPWREARPPVRFQSHAGNRTNDVPFRSNVITLALAAIESVYIQLF